MSAQGSRPSEILDLRTTSIKPGITMIEASAGTGKTYTLTGLVLRLILESGLTTGQILVVTFTNAATEELSGRIRAALRDAHSLFLSHGTPDASDADPGGPSEHPPTDLDEIDPFMRYLLDKYGNQAGREALRRALLDFDELTVATIHGFCKRVLEESAFESGLPFEVSFLESDDALLVDAFRDVWRRLTAGPELRNPLFSAWASERDLGPESFVRDYRNLHRHPQTVLLPRPRSVEPAALAEALHAVDAARRRLRKRFDRAKLRLALVRLPIREGHELADPERLKSVLAAADSFIKAPGSSATSPGESAREGLWAVIKLGRQELRRAVPKTKHKELERLTGPAEIDRLLDAFQHLEHVLRCVLLDQVHVELNETKEKLAALAFDDLLHRLDSALRNAKHGPRLRVAVRRRFQAALIDEFQDTDLIQYRIFKTLFSTLPLFLVGDPKQAIYGFRGADIFAYLLARRDARKTLTLARNWRSSARLIEAVNGLFTYCPHPFVFDEISFHPVEPAPGAENRRLIGDSGRALEWLWLPAENSRARAEKQTLHHVAQEVARLLQEPPTLTADRPESERPLQPGDIAILVRTNAQAVAMQEHLRQVGVPSVVGRSGDIFQSREMDELLRWLDAVVDPARGERLRAACAGPAWGADAETIHRLQRDDGAFQRLVDRFDDYRQDWLDRGFMPMIERLLTEQDVRHRLLSYDGGERRLTNLQHAVEVLHQAIHDRALGPAALVSWARSESRLQEHDRDAAELRLESDSRAVSLVTVHKSKGLEYEVVICPFLWDSRAVTEAPVLAHTGPDEVVFDCGSAELPMHIALADAERLAEDLRLTYVALTRAKRRCLVVWGDIGRGAGTASSALAYLIHRRQAELPVDALENAAHPAGAGPAAVARRVAAEVVGIAERRDVWLHDLQELVKEHPDSMAIRELESHLADTYRIVPAIESTDAPTAMELPARARSQVIPWRISSFTSLIREGEREVPDRGDPDWIRPSQDTRAAEGIFAFARGPRAGDCLHQVFEALDFCRWPEDGPVPDSEHQAVAEVLERFRLHRPEAHGDRLADPAGTVVEMIQTVLGAPLPTVDFSLNRLPRSHKLVEWQFFAAMNDLRPLELADLFRAHGQASWTEPYAERLERLGRDRLQGFLTGFVDLLFQHENRWYVVDWKSNHLGNRRSDYHQEAMTQAMVEHHYILQYHFYVAAAHRFLGNRLPDWSYERDFGGVFYIFLRGAGASPPPTMDDPFHFASSTLYAPADEAASGPTEPTEPPLPPQVPEPLPLGQLSLFGLEPSSPKAEKPAPSETKPMELALPQPETSTHKARNPDLSAPEDAEEGSPPGVFFDRPPRALVDALARRIEGTGDRDP